MGAFLLTNVSGLGYEEAYAPLCNFTRNAATCVLCSPYWEQRFDENGQNGKVEKVLNFMWTCDHRFIDGAGGADLMKNIKAVWENPEAFDKPYEELKAIYKYGEKSSRQKALKPFSSPQRKRDE